LEGNLLNFSWLHLISRPYVNIAIMICCPIANVVISIGTPKQTLMNLWQTTNVKHFANTHYYIFRTNFKNYDRKERDAAY
ncbi:hypothetical protein AAAT34_12770, partial [Hallella faecis]